MAEKTEIEEEEVGKRFADLPEHMQQDEDVPAFLRNRGKRLGKFKEACPACNEVHDEVTLTVGDDGFSRYKCPVNHAIVINTPDGLVCEANVIEEDDVVVKMSDAGNRHLSAQIADRDDAEPITVERAVRAPIKSSYSEGTFTIIKTAKGRLTKCEERKDELRKMIEASQNELASLTTESDLLRDTISRFEASSEDDAQALTQNSNKTRRLRQRDDGTFAPIKKAQTKKKVTSQANDA